MSRIILPVLAFLGLAKATKRRKVVNRLSGKTPDEAHALIVNKVSKRTANEAKANAIADRLVAKLDQKGILADA